MGRYAVGLGGLRAEAFAYEATQLFGQSLQTRRLHLSKWQVVDVDGRDPFHERIGCGRAR